MAFGLKLQKMPQDRDRRPGAGGGAASSASTSSSAASRRALSGGQRQRVAMGRAIVRHPQAFLMDEPLSNLDAKLRVQMRSEIARIQHDLGVTTIYVTHDQTEAMTMGDRVAVIRKGDAAAGRQPADALRAPGQPVRRRLHRLAGDEPDRGHARRPDDGRSTVEVGGFRLPVPDEVVAQRPALQAYVGPHGRARHPARGHGGRVARRRCAGRAPHPARRSSCARRSAPTSSCTSPSTRRRR